VPAAAFTQNGNRSRNLGGAIDSGSDGQLFARAGPVNIGPEEFA
jgi:hypothetical protein